MINSVSSVNFRGAAPQFKGDADPFSRLGAYSKPDTSASTSAPKKKGKFWKKLGITLLTTAAIATALAIGAKKGVFKGLDATTLKDAGFMKKIGHYLNKAGTFVADKASALWSKLPFAKKAAGTTAAAETAETALAGAAEQAEKALEHLENIVSELGNLAEKL